MMKRILVIMAIGVSFAPAAFADSGVDVVMNYRPNVTTTGEVNSPDAGSAYCERQRALDAWNAEIGSDGSGGTASGAQPF